jgi:hypothetical protein
LVFVSFASSTPTRWTNAASQVAAKHVCVRETDGCYTLCVNLRETQHTYPDEGIATSSVRTVRKLQLGPLRCPSYYTLTDGIPSRGRNITSSPGVLAGKKIAFLLQSQLLHQFNKFLNRHIFSQQSRGASLRGSELVLIRIKSWGPAQMRHRRSPRRGGPSEVPQATRTDALRQATDAAGQAPP